MKSLSNYKNFFYTSLIESWYVFCMNHYKLNRHIILVESHEGRAISNIILAILKNINNLNLKSKIYIVVESKTKSTIINALKENHISEAQTVKRKSVAYWKLLAMAEYLINDSMFPTEFIKRKKQKYFFLFNLKFIRQAELEENYIYLERFQHNVLLADYLFYENKEQQKYWENKLYLKELYRGRYFDTIYSNIPYKNAIRNICQEWLNGTSTYTSSYTNNKKKNVFLFIDKLDKNGITASAINLLNSIDVKKRNYTVIFRETASENNRHRLKEIPIGCNIMSLGSFERNIPELIASILYYKCNICWTWVTELLNKFYDRMFIKYYSPYKKEGYFIHFTGYGKDSLHLFLRANQNAVFVHNDMERELSKSTIQHRNTLIFCYQNYDIVAGVSKAAVRIAAKIAANIGNYTIVHNCFDHRKTIMNSNFTIHLNEDAEYFNGSNKNINEVLSNSGTKIITIGRFSPEKQHYLLLDAFSLYVEQHQDAQLIIIGGYGSEYKKTIEYVKKMNCNGKITIIKSIDNPMPILKKCDVFILSSSHEGLPVVLFEADCLHKPIISTDIAGPHELLITYKGGKLVEKTVYGLYNGLLSYDDGNIPLLNIDMNKFNQKCLSEFEAILNYK